MAHLLAVLLSLQTKSETYWAAFVAYVTYVLGVAHQPDEQALHDAALRALQTLNEQEGAAIEAQLYQETEIFCTHYWKWYRSLAEGVMAEVLQHPVLVQLLVENPQLCLADAVALAQLRN